MCNIYTYIYYVCVFTESSPRPLDERSCGRSMMVNDSQGQTDGGRWRWYAFDCAQADRCSASSGRVPSGGNTGGAASTTSAKKNRPPVLTARTASIFTTLVHPTRVLHFRCTRVFSSTART